MKADRLLFGIYLIHGLNKK